MKLNEQKRNVRTYGEQASTGFKINASGKAFRILSDGIYSNKIGAVVREISCNAADAHAVAKKSEPFIVHLPNNIEPWFAVEDFGIGMSNEQVMQLYTTYFESTKTESNDSVGAFGLGSKSPFSYSDSFTVISTYNGTRTAYMCYINESDLPTISVVNQEQTTDPNGIKVQVPVKSSDYYRFYEEARKLFFHFNPRPTIVGAKLEYDSIEKDCLKFEQPGKWKVFKPYRLHDFSKIFDNDCYAIQGGVAYPVNSENIFSSAVYKSANQYTRDLVRFVLDNTVHMHFPIGHLSVATSREALAYDEYTINNLITGFVAVGEDIIKKITTVIKTAKNPFQASEMYSQHISALDLPDAVTATISKYLTRKWKGITFTIGTHEIKLSVDDFKTIIDGIDYIEEYTRTYRAGRSGLYKVNRRFVYKDESFETDSDNNVIMQSGDTVDLYWADSPHGGKTRLRHAIRTKQHATTGYLISGEEEAVKKLFKIFGQSLQRATDLPAVTYERSPGSPTVQYVWDISGKFQISDERKFDLSDEEFEDGAIYVVHHGNAFYDPSDGTLRKYNVTSRYNNDAKEFSEKCKLAEDLGWADRPIVAIRKKSWELVKDKSSWISFDQFFKEAIDNFVTKSTIGKEMIKYLSSNDGVGEVQGSLSQVTQLILDKHIHQLNVLSSDSIAKEWVDTYKEKSTHVALYKKLREDKDHSYKKALDTCENYIKTLRADLIKKSPEATIKQLQQKFYKQYPLIETVLDRGWYTWMSNQDKIINNMIDYIQLIDERQ